MYMDVTKPVSLIQHKYERIHLSVYTLAFHVVRTYLSYLVQAADVTDGFVVKAVRMNFRIPNTRREVNFCSWSVMNTLHLFYEFSIYALCVLFFSLFIF